MQPIFELQNVSVARGSTVVLHDIDLTLAPGEHLAILGPNGCGKSTLLKTMTCELYPLVKPETSVRILGRQRWDLTELRRRLGVVSAELPGRPMLHTTGLDAVMTGFFSSSTLWPNLTVTPAMRERAEELLERVGATRLATQEVGTMSAGQQRRIMIARALAGSRASRNGGASSACSGAVGQTEMLLLDEPSNALDLAAQQELRRLLRELAQGGTAIVLITHHSADIIPEIDRVLLMRAGRIVSDGPKRELLKAPVISELFGTELDITERDGFFFAW